MLTKISKSLFFCFTLLCISGLSHGQITFPVDIGERPESIIKAFDGDYFVSVMNKKQPKDGVIVRLDVHGKISTFATGFDEPKGLTFIGNHLYVTDLTKIWKIDQQGNAVVFAASKDFPHKTLYLNDIVASPDGTGLYVTEMGAVTYMRDESGNLWPLGSEKAKQVPAKGRVYYISLSGKVSEHIGPSRDMLNPNGVGVANNGELLISDFFTGNLFTVKDKKLTLLSKLFRGADAIEQGNDGHYYLSSWTQAKAWKINGKTLKSTVLIEGLRSAADFYLDEDNKRLLLPDMLAGTINEVKL
ncbi:hypothetical protein [Paraglaciecola sp.]|uniref:hypothetical protein n=1 Tax=Paraglaciecola sp. TaxID=1920173 RepID=UPI003EFAD943